MILGPVNRSQRSGMEVAPGIHRFGSGLFNSYVISEGGRLTVVDAGLAGHYRQFCDGLNSIGRSERDVDAIVISHGHADHVGFAGRLALESGAPILVHPADRSILERVLQLPWAGLLTNAWHPAVLGMFWHAARGGLLRLPSIRSWQPVGDGAALDIPGRPTVLHVPGHTPGGVALHLPGAGVLFSGDALMTLDIPTGAACQPCPPRPRFNEDDREARRSAERLRSLGTITLLPGHGAPWVGDLASSAPPTELTTR
jgi:glyoxylase-like metal-dependent hydrolase (beta-lactamase superfamily II)